MAMGTYVPLTETPSPCHVLVLLLYAESWPGGAGPTMPREKSGEVMDAELNPKELLERIVQLKEHL